MAAPVDTAPAHPPHWTDKLQSFDRRWIFLAMSLAVVVPLFFPLNLPARPDPMTKAAFNAVESLPPGARVFVSMDFDPASTPELEPYYRAVMLHLKRKDARLVLGTLWYSAPPLVERLIRESVDQAIAPAGTPGYDGPPDRPYKANVDYAYLGFRDGKGVTIAALGSDLRKTFDGQTNDGTPLERIPFMNGLKQLKDFDLIVLISAGFPGAKEYVQFVGTRYNLKMVAACTAVSTTDLSPYFQTGQLMGLVGGMAGSAGYESLVGKKGSGTAGADVLNVGNVVIILAIIFGNIIFFASRAHRRRHGGRA